ncbi:hypothetical protein [Leclercia sp.]|uniref:hypothetical protein n=1 Tax=Leclercia sp. TaxID=1898428 RepID=UPI002FDD0441
MRKSAKEQPPFYLVVGAVVDRYTVVRYDRGDNAVSGHHLSDADNPVVFANQILISLGK